MLRGILRFQLFLLILPCILPGALLVVYSIITQLPHQVTVVWIIVVSLELIEKDSRIGEQHKQMVLSE